MNTIINNVDAYPTHTDVNGVTGVNVIYKVNYMNTLSDGNGNTATIEFSKRLNTDDISNMIEFSSLTESDVISWVSQYSSGYTTLVNETLKAKLNEMQNPSSINMNLNS